MVQTRVLINPFTQKDNKTNNNNRQQPLAAHTPRLFFFKAAETRPWNPAFPTVNVLLNASKRKRKERDKSRNEGNPRVTKKTRKMAHQRQPTAASPSLPPSLEIGQRCRNRSRCRRDNRLRRKGRKGCLSVAHKCT